MFYRKFGYKNKTVSLDHLEYLKRKSLLEIDDTERWELFDWNIDNEISAFGNRLNLEISKSSKNSKIYHVIRDCDQSGENSKIIQEILRKYLLERVKNETAAAEISAFLSSEEKISDMAKSLGFVDLLQRKKPKNDEISNCFKTLISEISDEQTEEIVKNIFIPEIMVTHNILTLWPRAWENPDQCLEEILGRKC